MDAIKPDPASVFGNSSPQTSFEQAIIDADGSILGTDASCKQGVDIGYNGSWSYHPLIVSGLANSQEPLKCDLVHRSGAEE